MPWEGDSLRIYRTGGKCTAYQGIGEGATSKVFQPRGAPQSGQVVNPQRGDASDRAEKPPTNLLEVE